MEGVSAESRRNNSDAETILNQVQHKVQHDIMVWFRSVCHPEPRLDVNQGRFGISVLHLEFMS